MKFCGVIFLVFVKFNSGSNVDQDVNPSTGARNICDEISIDIQNLETKSSFTEIKLTWKPHPLSTKCKIRYNLMATAAFSKKEVPYFRHEIKPYHIVKHLRTCTLYNVTVTPSLQHSNFTTGVQRVLYTLPESVENVTLQVLNNVTSILKWDPPFDHECISLYRVTRNGTTYNVTLGNFELNADLSCDKIDIVPVTYDNLLGRTASIRKPGMVKLLNTVVTHNSLKVIWKPPANEECVTRYELDVIDEDFHRNIMNTEYTFENLQPCKDYIVTIRAASNDTKGEATMVKSKTLNPDEIEAITYFNLSLSEYAIHASWKPAQNTSLCQNNYGVKIYDDKDIKEEQIVKETSISFGTFQLVGCKNYIFSVTQITNTRNGKEMQQTFNVEKVASPPIFSNYSKSSTWAALSWKLERKIENECMLLEIIVECSSDKNFKTHSLMISNDNRTLLTVKVTNLLPSTSYSCTAQIVNIKGISDKSLPVLIQTDEGVPSQPLNLIVKVIDKKIHIEWQRPEELPGNLLFYKIKLTSFGPIYFIPGECTVERSNEFLATTPSTVTEHEFDIKSGYMYTVSVWANTQRGAGPPVVSPNVTTRTEKPKEPRQINITQTGDITLQTYNITLNLMWLFPCEIGGIFRHFSLELKGISRYEDSENEHNISKSIYWNKNPDRIQYISYVGPLRAYYTYMGSLQTINDDFASELLTFNFTTPEYYPDPPIIENVLVSNTSITLNWMTPIKTRGILTLYTIEVLPKEPLHYFPDTCKNNYEPISIDITSDRSYATIDGLKPNYKYLVSIKAGTNSGFGNASMEEFQSLEGESELPRNISLNVNMLETELYEAEASLSFLHPCNLNGKLKNITISGNGTRENYQNDNFLHFETVSKEYYEYTIKLKPAYSYSVNISIETDKFLKETKIDYESPTGVPILLQNQQYILTPIQIDTRTAQFVLSKRLFSEENGEMIYYAIILGETSCYEKSKFGLWDYKKPETWPGIEEPRIRRSTQEIDVIKPYQVTPPFWNPFTNDSAENFTFTLGKDQSDSFYNPPLQIGVQYTFKIRGFTKHGYKDTPTVTFQLLREEKYKFGLLFGIVLGTITTIVIVVFAILVNRNKVPEDERPETKESIKELPMIPVIKDASNFPNYYNVLLENKELIEKEFALLGEKSNENSLATSAALLTINKTKNRYSNILPYDETRVKLANSDENSTDYINASYIKGFNYQEYIATQGPLKHTCLDFWKMVWQEDINVIVMLTQIVEHNTEKCYKYFPDDQKTMDLEDGFSIHCSSERIFDNYCIRILKVHKSGEERDLLHLHYTKWPDFGCPSNAEGILEFIKIMKKNARNKEGKILGHCSAGVGRTGTLIALDILLEQLEERKAINIFGTVLYLRMQRKNMVQTEKQYLFIHTCINSAIKQSDPTSISDKTENGNGALFESTF